MDGTGDGRCHQRSLAATCESHVAAVAANWRDEHDKSRYHYLGTVMTIVDADSDEQARAVALEYMYQRAPAAATIHVSVYAVGGIQ